MKAIVQRSYGGPETLELGDLEPPAVGPNEVLVRVHAASVHVRQALETQSRTTSLARPPRGGELTGDGLSSRVANPLTGTAEATRSRIARVRASTGGSCPRANRSHAIEVGRHLHR
jgi:NADPH:quinone reductase-like Zn-dependent oxidoreductase